jgi:hypothetical protein
MCLSFHFFTFSLAGQNEERGLEGILGIVRVVQHAPADAEDHRTVGPHDSLERGLISMRHEPLQQLPLAGPDRRPVFEEALDAPE